jgi:DNA-binding transcriptional LysR family regulator
MDLYQLRGFYEIARERSFTRAADKLFLTQPAISLQIKALENEMGEVLFDRKRRQIRLTAAGEVLFEHVRQVFNHLEDARNEMAALREALRGRLVLGTSDTNCTYILPGILEEYRRCYPGVELDIRNRMSPEIAQLVAADEVDIGVVTLPVRHRDVCEYPLLRRREVLICRPDHALGARKRVGLEKAAEFPMLVLERGSTSRQLLDAALSERDVHPQIAMELGGIEVLKRFVEIGLGLAIVPQIAVVGEVERGQLHAVEVAGLPAGEVGLIERRGRLRSAAASAFVELIESQLADQRI